VSGSCAASGSWLLLMVRGSAPAQATAAESGLPCLPDLQTQSTRKQQQTSTKIQRSSLKKTSICNSHNASWYQEGCSSALL
jgi:hypothetical protein